MKLQKVKLTMIGNSRGIRIPAPIIKKYNFGDTILLEESIDGILLRPLASNPPKLSWDETAKAMSTEQENWSEWDGTTGDGLTDLQWSNCKIAETGPEA